MQSFAMAHTVPPGLVLGQNCLSLASNRDAAASETYLFVYSAYNLECCQLLRASLVGAQLCTAC